MYFVYILYSRIVDRYYVGQTYCISTRLIRHSLKTTKFTMRADDWNLVYSEEFATRRDAIKREREIKSKKSRSYIETLSSTTFTTFR